MNQEQLNELNRLYDICLGEYRREDAMEAAKLLLKGKNPNLKFQKKPQNVACCDGVDHENV